MAFDGNGNWISNFSAVADRDANIKILASRFDDIFIADIAQSFENCLTKDMQVKPQQAFDANSYKVINVANPTNDYDAVNKQTLDTILSTLYPVGSIYIGTQNDCPLATLITGSTWVKVSTKILTDIPSTLQAKGNGMSIGLTDGTYLGGLRGNTSNNLQGETSGYGVSVGSGVNTGSGLGGNRAIGVTTDSTKSGIVADTNATALTVNVWKRTA